MNAFFVPPLFSNITNYLKKAYTLDVRALSLMRIGIGMILLVDLIIRSLSIKAFFTDEGILPTAVLKDHNWNPYYFSFHSMDGSLWWQILLFAVNGLCIALLIMGYRTRLFTFICWAFLVSLQNRNPFILQGGDELLKLMLLWGIFLPWGERYSIQRSSLKLNHFFSLANVGYMLLIGSVYFFSALYKTSPEWHSEGTAIYYALSLDQMRMPLGSLLYNYPSLMIGLTPIVYYIELFAPLLILLPLLFPKIRFAGIILIMLLHIGIATTLYVGLFYIIGIVSLIGVLPAFAMDWFDAKFLKRTMPSVTIDNDIESQNPSKFNFMYDILFSLKNGLIIFIIGYCLLLNLSKLNKFPYTLSDTIGKVGAMLRLEQSWGMFSPSVLKADGFFVYGGFTNQKKLLDVKHNKDSLSFAKPDNGVSEFESDRWRKFGENYLSNYNNYMRPYYCRYLLRKWNKEHPDKSIIELTIFYMKELSLPNYQTKPLEKLVLCSCQNN